LSDFSQSVDAGAGRESTPDELAALRPAKLVLAEDVHVGEALRRARESLGLDVEDIALATHVRADYLAALEELDLDPLPARPFAVGYVRAYARALGLDPEAVVARFRREIPGEDTALRAPLGAQFRRHARFGKFAAVSLVVIIALVGWNLFVRLGPPRTHVDAAAATTQVAARPNPGPAMLGAPLPAPPEATTPPPYVTPGLAAATAAKGPDEAAAATARIAEEAAQAPTVNAIAAGAPFAPHGAVYGAPRGGTGVILQAMRPMSLVVRGAGGQVFFARQLAAGEAWRAPAVGGLTADVDVPQAAEIFVAGRAVGPLSQSQTPIGSMTAANSSAR